MANPATMSVPEEYRATPGQPTGTTYKWEISSGADKAHIIGSDTSSTVTLRADAEGDFTLKLTYTLGGSSCVSYFDTAVQKPNQDNSYVECYGWGWVCWTLPDPPYMEATRYVDYYIRDGSNRPVPHALWDETWASGCNLTEADAYVNCYGYGRDTIWVWAHLYCNKRGVICSDTQTIKVEGWPVTGYFWTNHMTFNDGAPPSSCPYVDLAEYWCPSCY